MTNVTERTIKLLEVRPGFSPFETWIERIRDRVTRIKILSAIARLANPNYRGFKGVSGGVQELRIYYGPGYRVYFGLKGNLLILLLGGGDKQSQQRDIHEAQTNWKKYKDEIGRFQRKLSDN